MKSTEITLPLASSGYTAIGKYSPISKRHVSALTIYSYVRTYVPICIAMTTYV